MLKKISKNKIDNRKFNWIYNRKEKHTVYPPIVWKSNNKYYQLNYFHIKTDEVILIQGDFKNAFEASLNFYDTETVNLVELSNILNICLEFQENPTYLQIFKDFGVKGKNHFKTLKQIKNFPEGLKLYISQKNVSLRIINIYLKLDEILKNILIEYVLDEKPSVGDFRKFVNLLFDNGRNININYYDKEYFKNFYPKNDKLKIEFETKFRNLVNKFENIYIENPDYFETDTLKICFSFNSYENFKNKIKYLQKNEIKIKEIFNLMKEYDLH